MRKLIVLYIFIFLFSSFVYADFVGYNNPFNLLYTSGSNQTIQLDILRYSQLTNYTLSFTGFRYGINTYYCFQNNATDNTSGCGYSDGKYNTTNLGVTSELWFDGSIATAADPVGGDGSTAYLYANYSIPNYANNPIFSLYAFDKWRNYSIPSACYINPIQIVIEFGDIVGAFNHTIYCWDGIGTPNDFTTYTLIFQNLSTGSIYETGINWNITTFPTDISLEIGIPDGKPEFNNSGIFGFASQYEFNNSQFNEILSSNCDEGVINSENCRINFTIYSSTPGNLSLNLINQSSTNYNRYLTLNMLSNSGGYIQNPTSTFLNTSETKYTYSIQLDKLDYDWNYSESIYIVDNDNEHTSINTTFNVDYLLLELNFTMTGNFITITFNQSVDAILTTTNPNLDSTSSTSTGSPSSRILQYYTNLQNIRINLSLINNSDMVLQFRKTSTDNLYQSIEIPYSQYGTTSYVPLFDDWFPTNITNVYVYNDIDTYFYVQVMDESGTKIPDALIIVKQINASWFVSTFLGFLEVGRYTTDAEGIAYMPLDRDLVFSLDILGAGYSKTTKTIGSNIIQNNSATNPYLIKLIRDGVNVFGFGSQLPNRFWIRNDTIRGHAEYRPNRVVTMQTDYMVATGLPNEELPTRQELFSVLDINTIYQASYTYYINLVPGTHYNTTGNSNITIRFYDEGVLLDTRTIEYIDISPTVIANIRERLQGSYGYNFLLFLALIILTAIVQIIIKSDSGSVGVHIFMIGSILISTISFSFSLVSIICLSYYILKSIKPLIGVTG